tara:strand:+ start:1647 stop:4349 length:2703 start_codon:yes stop_codon:yes gene_type:complete
MPKKKIEIKDYRHKETRKNNPPAGMASYEKEETPKKKTYAYDPHLSPQLIWANKPGLKTIEVEDKAGVTADTVSLHVHERISTKAIIEAVSDKPKQMDFFGDPQLPLQEAIKFYQHDVDWSNRLILGDSLLVANSLIEKEMMAGKVQMIYMDPPYGIKYSSNFQTKVDNRNVKENDDNLTREPEMIKAYRDTWQLGIHSYLTYMRDRLRVSKKLLNDSGSIFVQIGEENVHIIRNLLDEVFGPENYVSQISVKRPSMAKKLIRNNFYYVLWYANNKENVKFNRLFFTRNQSELPGFEKKSLGIEEYDTGKCRSLTSEEKQNLKSLENIGRIYQLDTLYTHSGSEESKFDVNYNGKVFNPLNRSWKSDSDGMDRLINANRCESRGDSLCYKNYLDDYPIVEMTNLWDDTAGPNKEVVYVVQTKDIVPKRCMLMTTDPGDIVFDPTCGSGTTAYVAEQFGRRWITCDTSRVAISLTRQRMLTSIFSFYKIDDDRNSQNPSSGFVYKTAPHITLGSIANNERISFAIKKYDSEIQASILSFNNAANTNYKEWEIPIEIEDSWEKNTISAYNKLKLLKKNKQKEINQIISEDAFHETLYDKPEDLKGVTRVSGPITIEAIPAPVYTSDTQIESTNDELETFPEETIEENHIPNLITLLQKDGITFPSNKHLDFDTLTTRSGGILHAEGEVQEKKYAISFGPQHGPVSLYQVEQGLREANLGGFDEIIFCGFVFDPEATSAINSNIHPKIIAHASQIRPDIIMKDSEGGNLLKTTSTSQLFSVFGEPDIENTKNEDGKYVISLHGVDIYNPLDGATHSENSDKVAAWFIDTDYNGRTFCIVQAFFPDKSSWKKLEKALKGSLNQDRFEMLTGKESIPFKEGKYKKAAVKVIDQRGNEVMKVLDLA